MRFRCHNYPKMSTMSIWVSDISVVDVSGTLDREMAQSWSLGGYEFGLELEYVLGKFDKNELQRHFINGISISSTFIVFISYSSSHLRIYVFSNFRFVGFELRGFSPLESEWAKKG